MSIGEKIRGIRQKKGLTQEALGLLCGLRGTYINHIEKGRYKNLTVQTAQKLAEALEVSPEELMETEISDKAGLPDQSVTDMLKSFTADFAGKLQKGVGDKRLSFTVSVRIPDEMYSRQAIKK